MTQAAMDSTMVAVTPEARKAAADLLDEVSGLLGDDGIGQVADLIRDGEYDEHDATIAFAKFERDILARHRIQSEGRAGAGEALDKRTFLTCVSGDGPTPYLKVHFNTLADAHAAHDQLLGRKGNR